MEHFEHPANYLKQIIFVIICLILISSVSAAVTYVRTNEDVFNVTSDYYSIILQEYAIKDFYYPYFGSTINYATGLNGTGTWTGGMGEAYRSAATKIATGLNAAIVSEANITSGVRIIGGRDGCQNNWTFYNSYVKLVTNCTTEFRVYYPLNNGTGKQTAWNDTSRLTAAATRTDSNSTIGLAGYNWSSSYTDDIFVVAWDSTLAKDMDYIADDWTTSQAELYLAYNEGNITANALFESNFRVLPINSSATGDERVLSQMRTFKNDYDWQGFYDFYVCPTGSDTNDGMTTATPIKTITELNSRTFDAGTNIKFCRDGRWRTYEDAKIDIDSNLNYGTYGTGANPLFLGSLNVSNVGNWSCSGNYCNLTTVLADDVGNIVFGNDAYFGDKESTKAAVGENLEFYYDTSSGQITLYTTGGVNPVTTYGYVELSMEQDIVDFDDTTNVYITALHLKNGGAHGFAGSRTSYINISGNIIDNIGGAILSGTTMYGNGIEYYSSSNYTYTHYNNITNVFDACISHQITSIVSHISYGYVTYNICKNHDYGYEYFNGNAASVTHDMDISQNDFINSGSGIAKQRDTTNGYCFRLSSTNPATTNFVIKDNICLNATLYNINVGAESFTTWDSVMPTFNYNYYNQTSTNFATWNGTNRATFTIFNALTGQEANGVSGTWNVLGSDYRPISGSTVCTMSSTGSYVGALPCAGNTPPTISSSTILNATAYKNTNLRGQCTATDLEGDTLGYSYNWYRNTTILNLNSTLLGVGNFSKNDWITFYCNVTDNTNPTVYLNSSVVTILNSQPTKPTLSVVGTTLTYNSTDNDGDLITYYIYLNESLYTSTTLTTYIFGLGDGSYNSTVEATDGIVNSTMSDYVYFGVNGCGDGVINGAEECDLTNTNGMTCNDFGFNRGTLSCSVLCTFDTSTCETVNVYVDSLYNATEPSNAENIVGFIAATNNGVGQTFMSAFFLAFFFVFIMALKRFPLEDVFPAVSFVFFIISIFLRQAGLVTFYLVILFFFFLAGTVAFHFIKGEQ